MGYILRGDLSIVYFTQNLCYTVDILYHLPSLSVLLSGLKISYVFSDMKKIEDSDHFTEDFSEALNE